MLSMGERICPACNVVLPSHSTICVKCGRKVERERTGNPIFDGVKAIHPWLVSHFGAVGGTLIAGVLIIVLFAVAIGAVLMIKFKRDF